MMEGGAPRAVPDAIGRIARFDYGVSLPVLGIPVTYETNDARVLDLIEQAFGRWRALEGDAVASDACHVRILVEPGDEAGEHASLKYRVTGDGYVLLTTSASAGYADPLRREARAWVTDALVADTQHFRYGVLESLTIALLSRLDRQPVHAAAIVHGGAALLIAGPSGTGKSTLAYAAASAGLEVLAEDVVYVQRSPRLRVWGGSPFVHLSPEVTRFFPELAGSATLQLANGKQKRVVDLRTTAGTVRQYADRAAVCLLRRCGGRTPLVRELSPQEIVAALSERLEPGFDLFEGTAAALHAELAAGGGWELTVGGPPADHIPLLRRMLDDVVERS